MKAAGVNRPDIFQRRGLYPPPPGVTDIPGLEVAGRIVALGESVSRWKGAEFPLKEAAQAHQLMEEGRHIGKIVLTVD